VPFLSVDSLVHLLKKLYSILVQNFLYCLKEKSIFLVSDNSHEQPLELLDARNFQCHLVVVVPDDSCVKIVTVDYPEQLLKK